MGTTRISHGAHCTDQLSQCDEKNSLAAVASIENGTGYHGSDREQELGIQRLTKLLLLSPNPKENLPPRSSGSSSTPLISLDETLVMFRHRCGLKSSLR